MIEEHIYKNATFCQDRCLFLGMDYNLMVAKCLWDSSLHQRGGKNIIENDNIKSNTSSFIEFLKSFI